MRGQQTFVPVFRVMVKQEGHATIQSFRGSVSGNKPKVKNGRRRGRKARGKWRPGGPGRPPKAVAEKLARKKAVVRPPVPKAKNGRRRRRRRRGPGRPPGLKKKAA